MWLSCILAWCATTNSWSPRLTSQSSINPSTHVGDTTDAGGSSAFPTSSFRLRILDLVRGNAPSESFLSPVNYCKICTQEQQLLVGTARELIRHQANFLEEPQ